MLPYETPETGWCIFKKLTYILVLEAEGPRLSSLDCSVSDEGSPAVSHNVVNIVMVRVCRRGRELQGERRKELLFLYVLPTWELTNSCGNYGEDLSKFWAVFLNQPPNSRISL